MQSQETFFNKVTYINPRYSSKCFGLFIYCLEGRRLTLGITLILPLRASYRQYGRDYFPKMLVVAFVFVISICFLTGFFGFMVRVTAELRQPNQRNHFEQLWNRKHNGLQH